MDKLEVWIPLLIAIAAWIPAVIKWVSDRKVQKTQAEFNITQSAKEIAEGGERAVEAVTKILERYEDDNKAQKGEITVQRDEISALRAQIMSMQIDERAKEARLNLKIEALEQYIKLLIDVLRSHDIPIPPRPDIMKESDPKIRAIGK